MAKPYSAKEIKFFINAIPIDSGRADGSFLEAAQQNPDVSYTPSADGDGTFNQRHDRYTVYRVTLLQTSQGNSILSALHNASKLAGGLQYPVYTEDANGTSRSAGTEAMIIKTPDETYATEAGTVVWEIGVKNPERFVGGH